jgi:hypothetical protein
VHCENVALSELAYVAELRKLYVSATP